MVLREFRKSAHCNAGLDPAFLYFRLVLDFGMRRNAGNSGFWNSFIYNQLNQNRFIIFYVYRYDIKLIMMLKNDKLLIL